EHEINFQPQINVIVNPNELVELFAQTLPVPYSNYSQPPIRIARLKGTQIQV
ncbi:3832_t:CDS:1, partial [Funneliformis mosseae]